MKPAELKKLEQKVRGFSGREDNYKSFISQALSVLRDTELPAEDRPVMSLKILSAMFGTAYAGRPNEKNALNDVGGWLTERLSREPDLSAEVLAEELGWMKRIAAWVLKERTGNGGTPRDRSRRRPEKMFGKHIEMIEKKRALNITRAKEIAERRRLQDEAPEEPKEEKKTVKPLGDTFRARFEHLETVRQIVRNDKKRQKKGKQIKPRRIAIRRAEEEFDKPIYCMNTTPGFSAVYDEFADIGGKQKDFVVSSWRETGDGIAAESLDVE